MSAITIFASSRCYNLLFIFFYLRCQHYSHHVAASSSTDTIIKCLSWCDADQAPWKIRCRWNNCAGCSKCAMTEFPSVTPTASMTEFPSVTPTASMSELRSVEPGPIIYPPDFFPTKYHKWAEFMYGSKNGSNSKCNDLQTYKYEKDGVVMPTCVEGLKIKDGEICTPRCNEGLVPSFAKLICKWGALHPTGLMHDTIWTESDGKTGLQFKCAEKDRIPEMEKDGIKKPGLKRGMSIYNHWNQDAFYKTYDPKTIGWWYSGGPKPNSLSFTGKGDYKLLKDSNFFPMWGYLEEEDYYMYPGSDYIGMFNEPEHVKHSNLSVEEILELWPRFFAKVEELAKMRDVTVEEIKIGSPAMTLGHNSIEYAEEFFARAKAANMRIDFISVHSYSTKNGICLYDQLRDEMSHIRFKFNLPIWITEVNCGNGYWNKPVEDHSSYMNAALPMLESHPFVVRYNWFSSLPGKAKGASLNYAEDYNLTPLGHLYNDYVWDGSNSDNPQWNHDDPVEENPECIGLTEPVKIERPDGSGKLLDCDQEEKKQKSKCKKDWFRQACPSSCCAIGSTPVTADPKCLELNEPDKVEKPDGSGKMLNCNLKEKKQKSKCEKDWFRQTCPASCCAIGSTPVTVNPKCLELNEPDKVEKPDGSGKMLDCNLEEEDQKSKCKKDWFRQACPASCCAMGSIPVTVDPECLELKEPVKVEKPDGSGEFLDCNLKKKKTEE